MPFGGQNNAFRRGYRRFMLEPGSRLIAASRVDLAETDLACPQRVECTGEAGTILRSFLASDAFRAIQTADEVHREVPFVITLDGEVWSGQIDVLYRRGEHWIVADYKSDREERPERHRLQADVYKRAAQRALGLAAAPEFRLVYLRTGRGVTL